MSYQSLTNPGLNQMLNMQLPAVGTSAPVSSGGSSSLVGAALDFGQTLLHRYWQKKDYNQQRQDALADYSMQRQDYLDDLAAERAYNSPAAQVARLKAAGINPNTAFGNGNVANTSSPAQAMASPRAAQFGAAPSSSFASAFLQGSSHDLASSMSQVQAREIEASIAESKARMLESLSRQKNIDSQTKGQMITNGWLDAMYSLDAEEKKANIQKSLDSLKTSELQRAELSFRLDKLLPAQVNEVNAAISHTFAEIETLAYNLDFERENKYWRSMYVRHTGKKAAYESSHEKMKQFETESRILLNNLEAQLKSVGLPSDDIDRFIQGMVHRLDLVVDAISPIAF